jgi:hypothetical protein
VISDGLMRDACDGVIIANGDLVELHPSTDLLEHGSHLTPLTRSPKAHPDALVVAASLDARLDFDWLAQLASGDVDLEIWGAVHPFWPEVAGELAALEARHPRVHLRGAYRDDDLPQILCDYRVGVLPYKKDDKLTRFIAPLTYYHYLNSGLDVVSSPIPAASGLAPYIHIVDQPDWSVLSGEIAQASKASRWSSIDNSWHCRWNAFVAIVCKVADRAHR